jgi:hypothetical protein
MVRESVFNTPLTTTRFYPMLDDVDADWDPRPRQSMGVQGGNGRRADLGSRRYTTIGQGSLKLKVELESKGAGVLLDWALGVSTVTAITGGSQQVYHDQIAGTANPSATIQVVKVQNNGTEWVETYSGCTATKLTIEQPEDEPATLAVDVDARSISTAVGAATTVYATGPTIFDHYQGAVGLGSTLVAPTTTALASGLTVFTDFRSWKLEIDHSADIGRRVIGSRNQPLIGKPVPKFTAKVEFNATTLAAALIAGTKLPFYQTWTAPEAGAPGGNAQMQVVLPQLSLTKGLPQTKAGATTIEDIEADVTNDGTNRDVLVVIRTADTVL